MPKLADLLCQSVNDSLRFDSAWYIQFAYCLNMDIERARALFETYGVNHIYTSTGLVMVNTPRNRFKLSSWNNGCVVVGVNGAIRVRTINDIGRLNRIKQKKNERIQYQAMERQKQADMIERQREQMFCDMQTSSCRKRQGKANSLGDIGQYINKNAAITLNGYGPKKRDIFVRIII